MRAIVIDVETRQVTEPAMPIRARDSGATFIHGVVGGTFCQAGVVARYPDGGMDILFVDDEGLLKEKAGYFAFAGTHHPTDWGFAGNGCIVGIDPAGETVAARIALGEVRGRVQFTKP